MKFFDNSKGLDELKKAFYARCHELHPDKQNGNAEQFRTMVDEYQSIQKGISDDSKTNDYKAKGWNDFEPKTDSHNLNQRVKEHEEKTLYDMLMQAIRLPNIDIEIAGNWIWIRAGKEYASTMKEIGFKFAGKKKMWFAHPWDYKKARFFKHKEMSMDEITSLHGSSRVDNKPDTQIVN